MFADTAMDVSTDISVLQTLLAQEGLTEEDWRAATEAEAEYLWDLQTVSENQAAGSGQVKEAGQAAAGQRLGV